MIKAKIRIITTAIILPLTSLLLILEALTQAAMKKKYKKYSFFSYVWASHLHATHTWLLIQYTDGLKQ